VRGLRWGKRVEKRGGGLLKKIQLEVIWVSRLQLSDFQNMGGGE